MSDENTAQDQDQPAAGPNPADEPMAPGTDAPADDAAEGRDEGEDKASDEGSEPADPAAEE